MKISVGDALRQLVVQSTHTLSANRIDMLCMPLIRIFTNICTLQKNYDFKYICIIFLPFKNALNNLKIYIQMFNIPSIS